MSYEEITPIFILVVFALFLVIERIWPARPLPRVRHWFLKGMIFFVLVGAMNGIIPALVLGAVGDFTVLHLSWLGTAGGALLTLLLNDLANYWVHRGMHLSPTVWRFTHQLHHSAERMDMLGASYFHPADFLLQNVVPSTLISILLGVSPEAAGVAGLLGFFFGVFPHLNVKTPRWLGYLIQRPEMHAVHHLRDVHAYNYGALALSDLLFGTWRNPEVFPEGAYGFWDGASAEVLAMLIGRDVSAPLTALDATTPARSVAQPRA